MLPYLKCVLVIQFFLRVNNRVGQGKGTAICSLLPVQVALYGVSQAHFVGGNERTNHSVLHLGKIGLCDPVYHITQRPDRLTDECGDGLGEYTAEGYF